MKTIDSVIDFALDRYDLIDLPKRCASATRFEEHYMGFMPLVTQNSSFYLRFEDAKDNADKMIIFGKLLAKAYPDKITEERVDFMARVGASFASKTYEQLKIRMLARKCLMIEAMIATSTFLAIRPTGVEERIQSAEERRNNEKARVQKERLFRFFRDNKVEIDRLNHRIKNDQHLRGICVEAFRTACLEWKTLTGEDWDQAMESPIEDIRIDVPKSKHRFTAKVEQDLEW